MLRRIEDILKEAKAENDALGADAYLRQSYSSCKPTPEFTRLKEAQYLGYFSEQYNKVNSPTLAWTRRNDAGIRARALFRLRSGQSVLVRHRHSALLDARSKRPEGI
jgi:hypothetical protein